MTEDIARYRGCLLGLAAGDALGASVDKKNYREICEDYGPEGILGYDLTAGSAEVSSYTQIAAFACNALLVGMTKGRLQDGVIPFHKYMAVGLREWSYTQNYPRLPGRMHCWVCRVPELKRKKCLDHRTLDTLSRNALGSVYQSVNRLNTPGALTAAVSVGLFFHPERMEIPQIGMLGAQTVALTHSDPGTFLSGAVVSYTVAGILQDRVLPLREHFLNAAQAVNAQFGREFPQTKALLAMVEKVLALADSDADPTQTMESFGCDTGPKALAGAMYAALVSGADFDRAMTLAVNHSGRSAAVGALTGAILGAWLGEKTIPDFYLESLEAADALSALAKDLAQASPRLFASRLFDDDWDRKYIQGEPVEKQGWEEKV